MDTYLSTGRALYLCYEMVTRYNSIDIVPEKRLVFSPHHFYSSLKDTKMTDEEHESIKKSFQTMKLENLGQLNKIYNFQDTIILCEVFEQRSSHL